MLALWLVGVWFLMSLPLGIVVGWLCSLNDLANDKLPISGELLIGDGRTIGGEQPITPAPAADLAPFGAVGIPA